MSRFIRPYGGKSPKFGKRVYVASTATVIGDVEIGDDVSIWPGAVIRADVNHVRIGARSSLQDGVVVHVSSGNFRGHPQGFPTIIGQDVTVGHGVILHGCRIEDTALIGMGSIVMDGVNVGRHAFVGAGALVASGKTIGEGELWLGNPARFVRRLTDAEIEALSRGAERYVQLKDQHRLLDP